MYRRQIECLIGMVILIALVSVTLAETVPEEAQRYMARGSAAVEMAKTPKDYERAVREFEQAAKLAPNWPDVYFNLGSVQANAGNYGEAMRHYKRYLELAPPKPPMQRRSARRSTSLSIGQRRRKPSSPFSKVIGPVHMNIPKQNINTKSTSL